MTADRVPATARMGPLGRRLTLAFVGVAVVTVALVTVAALVGTGRGLENLTRTERSQVAQQVADAAAVAYTDAGGWEDADLTVASAIAAAAGADLLVLDAANHPVQRPQGGSGGTGGGNGQDGPGSGTGSGTGSGDGSGTGTGTGSGDGSGTRTGDGSGTGTGEPSPSPTGTGPGSPSGASSPSGTGQGGTGRGVAQAVGAPEPAREAVVAATSSGGTVSAPVLVDSTQVGTVRLLFRGPASDAARTVAWWWIAVAAVAALGLALLAARQVTLRVSRPLAAVAATARRFAAGDRQARTGVAAPGEIGDVASALDEMADEVVAAESARRRAAADVAHELRTPLAALQAGLEEVRDGLVEPDPATLAGLHDQSLRLGRIVADLAALSAAEGAAPPLRRRTVDLARLVRDATAAQEPRLRAADLTVRTDVSGPVTVDGDPDRLRQVLDNLLSNAARYCRPGDQVTVSVRADGGSAVLEVSDTGPGIPPADLPHVFDRLWRGQDADRVGGSGIGLAVVRELVTAHGGTVVAESDGRTGTTLRVVLPLSA